MGMMLLRRFINKVEEKDKKMHTEIVEELQRLKKVLLTTKLAHCDVKTTNMVITFVFVEGNQFKPKLYLIDNDSLTKFGNIREVGTPGANCNISKLQNGEIVSEETDALGFLTCIQELDPLLTK